MEGMHDRHNVMFLQKVRKNMRQTVTGLVISICLINQFKSLYNLTSYDIPTYLTDVPDTVVVDDNEIAIKNSNDGSETTLYAIFHPGPGKMATSSIQQALERDVDLLQNDNYMLYQYRRGRDLGMCLRKNIEVCQRSEEWNDFTNFLDEARRRGKNIVISSEIIGSVFRESSNNTHVLQSALRPWNVRLVVGYRRFFEYIISGYFQLHRCDSNPEYRGWPKKGVVGGGGMDYKGFIEDYHEKGAYSIKHKTDLWLEHWGSLFPDDVKILNIHDGDVVKNFYCHMMLNASSTCSKYSKPEVANTAWSLFYDRLAVAAYEKGFMHNELLRADAALVAQIRQENILNLTPYDFPLKCMNETQKQAMLRKSLTFERQTLPDWYEVDRGRHERDFMKAAEKKLCDVDTVKVLKDKRWRRFFMNPKFMMSENQTIAAGFFPDSFQVCRWIEEDER